MEVLYPTRKADPFMTLYAIGDRLPTIDPSAFVHPDAVIIGDVTIGAQSSIWPGAVLRGDHGAIVVGSQTSIQDGSIIHCTAQWDTIIGDRCVVGHRVHLEGCQVHADSLIGSGSVVLQGATVGSGSLVAAQALVPPGTQIPASCVARGVPAKIIDTPPDRALIDHAVSTYVHNCEWYTQDLRRLD
jgi:carbonic anhydrase/acetyltransferase-like protein (isoleucine patch superfamily)